MRSAFNKEIVRSITHSWTRFIAIFAIVALGAGFYAGLRMCAPDMRITIDGYLDDTSFMDVRLVSTLGFSDADVEATREVDGVAAVMPARIADATATIGDRRATVRIHGLDLDSVGERDADAAYLNRPTLVTGRWPQRSGECVIDRSRFFPSSEQLDESVVLTAGTTALEDMFARTEFTVVGVVDSSYYLSFTRGTTSLNDGNIDRIVYIPDGDFADLRTYTDLFVAVEGAAAVSTFTSEHDEIVEPVIDALEAAAPARAKARQVEVKREAQTTLDDGRAEYDARRAEADARFADAQAEIDAAAATIAASEADIAAGQSRYNAGTAKLRAERRAFAAQLAEAQAQIDAGRVALDAQQAQLDQLASALPLLEQQVTAAGAAVTSLQAAYDAAVAEEGLGHVVSPTSAELAAQLAGAQAQFMAAQSAYATQRATHDAGTSALTAGRAELAARQAQLDAGAVQAEAGFASAKRTLDAAGRRLRTGRADLAAGTQELADARARYESERASAEVELAEALEELGSAQADIDAVELPEWYVLGRDTNLGYASLSADADRIEAISIVFPFIFFLVAALVSLTTMTRMVDEERTLIGTYLALGYGKGRIAAKYLVYAGIASVSGSVVGILIGSQVLPRTVWRAYTTMYTAPAASTPIDVPLALIAGLASVGVTLLATLAAVEATLREDPATLMLPRAPKPGKRIFLERVKPLWSRLSFSQKVTARNLFRYKKRLLMTVIGIAGCTALLLTGFGLKNSISDILDKQYGEIYLYDTIVGVEEGALDAEADPTAGAAPTLGSLLEDPARFSGYLVDYTEGVSISNADSSVHGYVRVPDDTARLDDFIVLRTRVGGAPLELGESGVVITEKASKVLDVEPGDTVSVEQLDATGAAISSSRVTLTVTGIAEQYVSHFVYLSPALYEEAFGTAPPYNEVLGKATVTDTARREALSQTLLGGEGVTTVQFTDDITGSFDDMLASLDSVVFILIFSAGVLAFIVLYNLTNINVTERQREIATIKVLGFYDAEVNAYIYRETAALATLGCALGLVLGIGLEAFVITTAEIDIVMFGRQIHAMSYVYSAALTLVFALIVNLAMAPRLRGIDMVESLKSVE